MFELVIFDLDGTLVETYTANLLPGVKEFFNLIFHVHCPQRPKLAIATNQGGVGMRHWMVTGGFGKPEKYPTRGEIVTRIQKVLAQSGADGSLAVYASYRYQNRQGKWAPVPPQEAESQAWSENWRKPKPGMLLQAMADSGVDAATTLFVGDSLDDEAAAQAAGCAFIWAKDFFARSWADCHALQRAFGASK
jgi:HAD superfamily hydrolase (TIGR01662 family)